MRWMVLFLTAYLVVEIQPLQGQERIPLPAPDPVRTDVAPTDPPPPLSTQSGQNPQSPGTGVIIPPGRQYQPQQQPFYPPYPPPDYGPPPYPRPSYLSTDPVHDPAFWVGFEGLLWWTKSQPLSVPLVTTGPASAGSNAGGLGVAGTTSLNGPLNYGAEGGFRLSTGGWFDTGHNLGMDGSLLFLGRQTSGFNVFDRSGTGSLVLNEPVAGAPYVTQVSYPGVQTGGVSVGSTSRLWGGDINFLYNLHRSDDWNLKLVGGFRFLQLNESIDIVGNSQTFVSTNFSDNLGNTILTAPAGSVITVGDHFGTRNEFYGGQIGSQFQYVLDRWYFSATGKIALGSTHESVSINGYTNVYPTNGNPVSFNGGNYATLQAGRYSTNRFAVAPEVQLNVGYQFTRYMRGTVGYNFLYLSNVLRPGNQIDNTYDGMIHPSVPMNSSSFWAQGVNFSLQFNF